MAGSKITLATGSKMTGDFRTAHPNVTKAVYYTADVYEDLLAQEDCVGIRIYNALDANGVITNVLVGVDRDGNDLINGSIYDLGGKCPGGSCSNNNSLNS
jgi:hypothetical protein